MSSTEAKGILKNQRKRKKKVAPSSQDLARPSLLEPGRMAELWDRPSAPTTAPSETGALIEAMVQTLTDHGNFAALEQMATAAEHAGKADIAAQIRSHLPPRKLGHGTQH